MLNKPMEKEDKEILLRDLCARLPYGVKCQHFDDKTPYALLGIDEDVLHIDCPVYDEGDACVEMIIKLHELNLLVS